MIKNIIMAKPMQSRRVFTAITAVILMICILFSNVFVFSSDGQATTYTVVYNGNGNIGGTVPVDSNVYAQGQTASIFGNTGNLSKAGYTFGGWNTQLDGYGKNYDVNYYKDLTLSIGVENVTLYAKWEKWNPVRTIPAEIQKDSALDLSFMNDAPAGKYGFVRVNNNGDYYFENKPSEKIRFYGANVVGNAAFSLTKEQAERLAYRLSAMGYNVARLHLTDLIGTYGTQGIFVKPTSTSVALHNEKLDNLEYFISKLKQNGVYVTLDVIANLPISDVPSLSQYSFGISFLMQLMPNAMALWKSAANAWLSHINPYTGLALKDDPVLVGVAPWNEAILMNMTYSFPYIKMNQWLLNDFNSFLTAKSKPTITKLAGSFYDEPSAIRNDLLEYFSAKTLAACNETKNYLKDTIGIKCPVGGLNMLNNAAINALRTNLDVQETHSYNGLVRGTTGSQFSFYPYTHPRFSMVFDPKTVETYFPTSGERQLQRYFPWLSLTQIYGKPFMLSEYTQEFPTKGREDVGIMTAAVGAHQGWDMLNRFSWSQFLPEAVDGSILGGAMNSGGATFTFANDDLIKYSEMQGAIFFRKGNLQEARPRFVIVKDINWAMTKESASYDQYSLEVMTYLTHLFKTVTVYADNQGTPMEIYKITPNLSDQDIASGNIPQANKIAIPTKSGSVPTKAEMVVAAQTFINALDDTQLKNAMLENLADNKLVSDTGELIFDLNNNAYQVNTPYAAGVAGTLDGNSYELGAVTLKGKIDKGTMVAASVDNESLTKSRRILLTYTTDVAATGQSFTQDTGDSRKLVYTRGQLPTLVKYDTGEFKLTTERRPDSFSAYKLDLSGNRVEEIPISINGNIITVAFETDVGFAFEIVSNATVFKSADSADLDSLGTVMPGDVITAKTNIVNDTDCDLNATLITALYKDGYLVNIKIKSFVMPDDAVIKHEEQSIMLPTEGSGYSIKSFLLNEDAMPLKQADTIE